MMGEDLVGRTFTQSQIRAACKHRDRLGFETHLCGCHRPAIEGRGVVQSFAMGFGSESSALFRFVGCGAEQLWRLEAVYQPWFVRALRRAVGGPAQQELF